jgi:hypothetical protein
MNEVDARQKLRAAYHKLQSYRGEVADDAKEQAGTIDQHIDAIRTAGNGEWSERIAKDYVRAFEEQVEEEMEESTPGFRRELAEDTITVEATDDPSRELGVSRRELKGELDRFDSDDDGEDMREYIEDADDEAGEDERYRYRD